MFRICLWLAALAVLALPACAVAAEQIGVVGGPGRPSLAEAQHALVGQVADVGWGIAEQVRAGISLHNAVGAAVGVPQLIQERLLNREAIGTTIGVPQEMRELFQTQETFGSVGSVPPASQERPSHWAPVMCTMEFPADLLEQAMLALTAEPQ
jgi:hypothetical protein